MTYQTLESMGFKINIVENFIPNVKHAEINAKTLSRQGGKLSKVTRYELTDVENNIVILQKRAIKDNRYVQHPKVVPLVSAQCCGNMGALFDSYSKDALERHPHDRQMDTLRSLRWSVRRRMGRIRPSACPSAQQTSMDLHAFATRDHGRLDRNHSSHMHRRQP